MQIEFHECCKGASAQSTLRTWLGREKSIEFSYEAEQWIQCVFSGSGPSMRAYVFGARSVYAVYRLGPDMKPGLVAKKHGFGEWQLPPVYQGGIDMAVGTIPRHILTLEQGQRWAAQQLKQANIATTIILGDQGIVRAWERGQGGKPVLVARGPEPMAAWRASN